VFERAELSVQVRSERAERHADGARHGSLEATPAGTAGEEEQVGRRDGPEEARLGAIVRPEALTAGDEPGEGAECVDRRSRLVLPQPFARLAEGLRGHALRVRREAWNDESRHRPPEQQA